MQIPFGGGSQGQENLPKGDDGELVLVGEQGKGMERPFQKDGPAWNCEGIWDIWGMASSSGDYRTGRTMERGCSGGCLHRTDFTVCSSFLLDRKRPSSTRSKEFIHLDCLGCPARHSERSPRPQTQPSAPE